uniref:Uncharacterized protein n=1 Tax=Paecilomyces divaricatus TaxID=644132 RepID=A0A3G1IHI9_PAEDI|nr:hypothetical protein [Paecilomyces divaricatus]
MLTTVKTPNAVQNIEILARRYGDIQANAANINTPCDCIHGMVQVMGKLPDHYPVSFDTILSLGADITTQCAHMVACEHCRTHWHAIITLQCVLDLGLALYEGAFSAYALGEGDLRSPERLGTGRRSRSSTLSLPRPPGSSSDGADGLASADDFPGTMNGPPVCCTSPMTWGDIEIHEEDAQLLAGMLLRRRLADLGALIGELKLILENVWHRNRPQQSFSLQECEDSLMVSMDRLVTLVGLLR